MTETQEYLEDLCSRINFSGKDKNIIYIKDFDDYVEQFLESEHATWIRRSAYEKTVYLPRYDAQFTIKICNDCSRGHKPRKVIIDGRLSIDLIKTIIAPTLIVCHSCNWF